MIRTSNSSFSLYDRNILPNGMGKPMLALMQLLICREVYRGGWKPDYNDGTCKYAIRYAANHIVPDTVFTNPRVLVFKSEKVRDEFLKNFRDLIEEAKELI